VPSNRPFVFVFEGLQPDTVYKIHIAFGSETIDSAGTVRTFGERKAAGGNPKTQARIGVVSCNKIYVTKRKGHKDVWAKLASEVKAGNLDVIFHLGDQVYADNDYYKVMNKIESLDQMLKETADAGEDNKYGRAMKLLVGKTRPEFDQFTPEIEELFRQIYRETWSWPTTAQVLANVSNIMFVDDHEVRDDWGQNEEDYDKSTAGYFVAEAGYRVSMEYQNALLEQITTVAETKDHIIIDDLLPSCTSHVGVLTVDTRGKAFRQPTFPYKDPSEPFPYLGSSQWKDISAALAAGGALDKADVLFFACGIPLAWLNEFLTNKVAKSVNDFEGMFTATPNIKELEKLLDELRGWKERHPGRRIVLSGGDVHLGGITRLYHGGKFLCDQMTSSAIANDMFTRKQTLTMSFLLALNTTTLPGNYMFKQLGLEFRNNYGVITVTPRKLLLHLKTNQTRSAKEIFANGMGHFVAKCCFGCACARKKIHLSAE